MVRALLAGTGHNPVLAVPPRSSLHRAQERSIREAFDALGGTLLILPVVGVPQPGGVEHYTRVRCDREMAEEALADLAPVLNLMPLGGPSGRLDVLLRAIVCRNMGASHVLVGVEDVPLGPDEESDFFGPMAEIGIEPVVAKSSLLGVSEAQIRERLLSGEGLSEDLVHPAVAAILEQTYPPRHRQGLTIWFTGLSGSGKSTVAHALVERLAEFGRNVSLLDGDEIRTHLSKGLGFSKEDRDANINRVGYVAGLIAQHGGTTLCSVVSPYRATRDNARALSKGNFVEVFCDTPIEVCERRDVKGLYAKARAGEIKGFTGVDDPYEPPLNPEVRLDTSQHDAQTCAGMIITRLIDLGYILPHRHP